MPISDKTRKLLWGKSGNRCAICKRELHIDAGSVYATSVVGDECHIVSRKVNGPRYNSEIPEEMVDSYDNLILLCRVHHKMIDDLVEDYTVDSLRQAKEEHVRWVKERLDNNTSERSIRIRRIQENIPPVLLRVTTGNELAQILDGAMGYEFDYASARNEDEMELLSEFIQAIQDYGDLWNDLEAGQRVRVTYLMTELLERMEQNDCFVFVARENRVIEGGNKSPSDWPVAIVHVRHKDNPEICRVDLS